MKKSRPAITNTEILCCAIQYIQNEIDEMVDKFESVHIPGGEEMMDAFLAEKNPKLYALKILYRIETGTDYI